MAQLSPPWPFASKLTLCGPASQIAQAQKILTEMQSMPGAWTRVDAVLTGTENQMTKYFALQVFDP